MAVRDALRNTWLNMKVAEFDFSEPSGDVQARSRSIHSTHPPDLVLLSVIKYQRSLLACLSGCSLHALLEEARPVLDRIAHKPAVHIVKFLVINPVRFHVINLKTNVRWDPAGRMLSVKYGEPGRPRSGLGNSSNRAQIKRQQSQTKRMNDIDCKEMDLWIALNDLRWYENSPFVVVEP